MVDAHPHVFSALASEHTTDQRADLRRLTLAAALTLCAYVLLWALPFPLLPWYDVPLLDLGKLADYDPLHAVALAAGYAVVFACYVSAWRAAARLRGRAAAVLVIGAGIVFALVLVWVYPAGANDIYDYVFRARLWGQYDYNPLTVTPLQVNTDPWFRYVVWIWFPSPYGPLWAEISVLLNRLGGDSLLANLLLFKLLAVACIALGSLLLFALLRERGEGEALGGTLLFAWNPLLLFEAAVNGHNDVLMAMLLLGGLWFFRRRRLRTALVLCTLAGLVKIAAFVALPVLLLAGARSSAARSRTQHVRLLFDALAACLLTAAAVYAPLWQGSQSVAGLLALDNRFTASAAAVVKLALEARIGPDAAEWLARSAFTLLFLGVYLRMLRRAAQGHAPLEQTLAAGIAALLIVGTLWFQPWYVTWLLALAPLAGRRWQRTTILWSAGALSLYLLYDFAWYWFADFFNSANGLVLNACALALWLGPVMLWRKKDRTPAGGPTAP